MKLFVKRYLLLDAALAECLPVSLYSTTLIFYVVDRCEKPHVNTYYVTAGKRLLRLSNRIVQKNVRIGQCYHCIARNVGGN